MRHLKQILLVIGLASLLGASATTTIQQGQAPKPVLSTRRGTVMGTSMLLEIVAPASFPAEAALDAAEAELRRVEDVMTTWRDSPLMRLNAEAGKGPQRVSEELATLIHRSLLVAKLTDGAFDPTWKAVGSLWDFQASEPVVPTTDQLRKALRFVDSSRVQVDLKALTVTLPPGFHVGLGGIAKGYGVDRAMTVLRKLGVQHALVDAGGDLKAMGRKLDKIWQIAIRHPRDRKRVLAMIPVSNRCVLTSGDYERFFEIDGKRYHHILDPRTGMPSMGCMSATIVGPDAATCDALATALCILSPKEGLALVAQNSDYEALLVGMDGAVHTSKGLTPNLSKD